MHPNKKTYTKWEIGKRYLSSLLWLEPCAGWVCLRERNGRTEILCVIHRDGGIMIPKWRVKRGEALESAVLREFQEETGLHNSRLGERIGIIRDRMRRKKITLFRVYHDGAKHTMAHDEAIMWVPLEEAPEKMKHASERKFVEKFIL